MAEKKAVYEITIEAAGDMPEHALKQLPVILKESERIMREHDCQHAYLGRGNIGKWALSLVRGVEVEQCFYILVHEQPQFTVESFDRKVIEADEDKAEQQAADMP